MSKESIRKKFEELGTDMVRKISELVLGEEPGLDGCIIEIKGTVLRNGQADIKFAIGGVKQGPGTDEPGGFLSALKDLRNDVERMLKDGPGASPKEEKACDKHKPKPKEAPCNKHAKKEEPCSKHKAKPVNPALNDALNKLAEEVDARNKKPE